MAELDIAGLGVWSSCFSNWQEFSDGINTASWQPEAHLQPDLIPPRERRRAPLSVKLAVEVMSQACEMASLDPALAAVVFSSCMGDMQITDYLCGTLSTPPRLVSPTRFHNSVHNATTGYWSIVSHSHTPANAISAHSYTAPMAFLEAAIQSLEENTPVLLVNQEMAAPLALHDVCPSEQPFSSAMLLTPTGYCTSPVASIEFSVTQEKVSWPELPGYLNQHLASNPGARLVPMMAAIASNSRINTAVPGTFEFPLTAHSSLRVSLSTQPKKEPGNE